MPGRAKQIVYRYNGEPISDEGFVDWNGARLPHTVDEIVERKGKLWRVIAIDDESPVAATHAIPIHRVYLTDTF